MRFAFLVFIAFVLLGINTSAQVKSTPPKSLRDTEEGIAKQNTLNLRIINILYQTADQAKGWEDVRTSSRIQAQAADLLWDFDPISAEGYLIKAWNKAKQAKESEEKTSRFRNVSNRIEVSREVLIVARKRQPELAEKWLKELSDLAEEDFSKRNKGLFDDRTARSAVLLQMAMQVVETDAQAAASLATESLTDGVSFGFQSVLIKIQEKDAELAAQVFRAALRRINAAGINNASEIQILYSYLYTPGRISATADAASQSSATIAVGINQTRITSAAELYPALAQEFIQTAARSLLRMPFLEGDENPEKAAKEQYGIINTILFRLGNSAPELSNALRGRLAAIVANANFTSEQPSAPPEIKPMRQGESRSDYQNRLLDEASGDADKITNPLKRDIFIAQTVLRSDAEQFEKAKNISEKIEDKELRSQVINFLIYRTSLKLIKTANFTEAYKLLQKNSDPRQKAAILTAGGQKIAERKDFFQARDWLLEAQKLFDKNKSEHEDWINLGFGLTAAYAQFDKTEAIRIFEKSGKLIKQDSAKYNSDQAPLAIGFSGLDFTDFTNNTKKFSLNSAINSFDKDNFEDVFSVLNELDNPEAKGQSILIWFRRNLVTTKPAQKPRVPINKNGQ